MFIFHYPMSQISNIIGYLHCVRFFTIMNNMAMDFTNIPEHFLEENSPLLLISIILNTLIILSLDLIY